MQDIQTALKIWFCFVFFLFLHEYKYMSAPLMHSEPPGSRHGPELTLNVQSHLLCQEIFTFSTVCHIPHTGVNSCKMHWSITDQQRWKGGISLGRKTLWEQKEMQANHGTERWWGDLAVTLHCSLLWSQGTIFLRIRNDLFEPSLPPKP